MTIERRHSGPRMSQVVVHNNTVYLSGIVADDRNADMATQTQQVLAKIDSFLAEVGSNKSNYTEPIGQIQLPLFSLIFSNDFSL